MTMKESLSLYKGKFNKYYYMPFSAQTYLYYLYMFITTDYLTHRTWDTELFTEKERILNICYVINDLENKIAYIGVHYDDPDDVFFHTEDKDINETNSCKISVDNFNEFIKNWENIKETQFPFAVIYRDDNDWVSCKGFLRKEEMEFFVKDPRFEIMH